MWVFQEKLQSPPKKNPKIRGPIVAHNRERFRVLQQLGVKSCSEGANLGTQGPQLAYQ